MELTGEFTIPALRETVWAALNDPEILRQSIEGCQSIDKVSDTEFTAKVVAKVGPVKATFTGKVQLSELDPPNSYTISGEGKGGVAGFANGSAVVRLTDVEGGTRLSYSADAQVGGKLAQLGSRLIEGTARAQAQDFFKRFAALVAPGTIFAEEEAEREVDEAVADGIIPPPPPDIQAVRHPDEAAALDEAARSYRGLPPWIWIAGVIVMVGVILGLAVTE